MSETILMAKELGGIKKAEEEGWAHPAIVTRQLLKALERVQRAAAALKPHMEEILMEGETGFERDVLDLWQALRDTGWEGR